MFKLKGIISSKLMICCCLVFLAAIFLSKTELCQAEEPPVPHIVINEICIFTAPSCDGGEWIELYNPTQETVDLAGYTIEDQNITDKNGVGQPIKFSSIDPLAYILLHKSIDFTFTMNDDEDQITLRNNSVAIDSVSYSKEKGNLPKKGETISRIPNGVDTDCDTDYKITEPTLGEPNKYEEITPTDDSDKGGEGIITIDEARKLSDGETVLVRGKVTVPPELLSSSYFYIQDESGGIQIYNYDKDFPPLLEGDLITVAGVLSTVSGERRVKISDPVDVVVMEHQEVASPLEVAISELSEEQVGQYVNISGTVSKTSGDTFYISDGKGAEIKVIIKDGTSIDKPKMRKGDFCQISGVLSIYNSALRILPFKQEDVKIIPVESGGLPEAGPGLFLYLYLIFAFILIWNLLLIAKKIQMRLRKKSLIRLRAAMLLLYMATLGAARQPLPVF